jgi:hypothetical protein
MEVCILSVMFENPLIKQDYMEIIHTKKRLRTLNH